MSGKTQDDLATDILDLVMGLAPGRDEFASENDNGSSPIKRRRRTKTDMAAIKNAMLAILAEDKPMTVRQVFYRLVSIGAIDKTEAEYKSTVCRLLTEMRLDGDIPFSWLADSTRWMRKPSTHDNLGALMQETARLYRRKLWNDQDVYCEIWLEKEALAGVLLDVTDKWDVPLLVTRGYPSISFLHTAACGIAEQGKPTFIYYFGDHDPSGVDIQRNVTERLHQFAPGTPIDIERVAVTPDQIEEWLLPLRPTKKSDTRAKNFQGGSVEVDAIPPTKLRELAEERIERHVDERQLQVTYEAERSEQNILDKWAEMAHDVSP